MHFVPGMLHIDSVADAERLRGESCREGGRDF